MTLKYYKELDGVRAIAALMVMVFHFGSTIHTDNPILLLFKKLSFFGQTGVSLFFVLSGFLITRILLSSKTEKNYFLNFYIRRGLRIFPLYYLYLFIYFFIVPLIEHTTIAPLSQQIYHWVYLQNFAITFHWNYAGPLHFWSLAVEEHFYLFFPLIIYLFKERSIIFSLIIIIVLAFITRLILVHHAFETFYFTLARMDDLAIGAVLAILELKGKLNFKNSNNFILLFIITLIPTVLIWVLYTGSSTPVIQVIKYSLISFTYFCIIGYVICSSEKNLFKKLLNTSPFIYTGKISYGLYVYHGLCFLIIERFVDHNNLLVYFMGGFGLSYLISTISFYFFENKFLILKKKFERSSN